MKKQIREVLSKYRGNQGYTMEHAESELLNLFSVSGMDKVYEFCFNECIYESASVCMSLHRTREGAEKAMERHRKETADKWGEIGIPDDMAWGISEWIIEE